MIVYEIKLSSEYYKLCMFIFVCCGSKLNCIFFSQQRFSEVDIRIKVKGGGHVAQVYAIRQAIAKSLVAYYQKCNDFYRITSNFFAFLAPD